VVTIERIYSEVRHRAPNTAYRVLSLILNKRLKKFKKIKNLFEKTQIRKNRLCVIKINIFKPVSLGGIPNNQNTFNSFRNFYTHRQGFKHSMDGATRTYQCSNTRAVQFSFSWADVISIGLESSSTLASTPCDPSTLIIIPHSFFSIFMKGRPHP